MRRTRYPGVAHYTSPRPSMLASSAVHIVQDIVHSLLRVCKVTRKNRTSFLSYILTSSSSKLGEFHGGHIVLF
jgi:hypothetical protein